MEMRGWKEARPEEERLEEGTTPPSETDDQNCALRAEEGRTVEASGKAEKKMLAPQAGT